MNGERETREKANGMTTWIGNTLITARDFFGGHELDEIEPLASTYGPLHTGFDRLSSLLPEPLKTAYLRELDSFLERVIETAENI